MAPVDVNIKNASIRGPPRGVVVTFIWAGVDQFRSIMYHLSVTGALKNRKEYSRYPRAKQIRLCDA